jgi:hypothetical protein
VTKNYQRTVFDTRALAVPEQVSVAMEEIAAEMRGGGCWPSRSVPGCR